MTAAEYLISFSAQLAYCCLDGTEVTISADLALEIAQRISEIGEAMAKKDQSINLIKNAKPIA